MGKKTPNASCIFGADFMLKQVSNLEKEFEGALVGEDIEYIHRMRVASRRLRNGLACFKDCLPKKHQKSWRDEIRRITKALGRARDLDIQIDFLQARDNDALDNKLKPGYRRLLLRLKQQRSKAQNKVDKTINKLQDGEVLNQMQAQLKNMADHATDMYLFTPSLYQQAFITINTALVDFLSYEEEIQSPENIEKLHAMRIAGKKLRYNLEIFAPIYDKALLPHIQVMKEIQDMLGTIHDDDVWISWLPKFIDQERTRIEDYFGNTGPLKRLLPGIHHLIDDRQNNRDAVYHTFITTWETLKDENAWKTLKEIIKTPINVEAALKHLSAEEQTVSSPAADHGAKSNNDEQPLDEIKLHEEKNLSTENNQTESVP